MHKMKKRKKKKSGLPALAAGIAAAALCVALGWLLEYELLPAEEAAVSAGPIEKMQISEAMSLNKSTLADGDGRYSDWIEIVNADSVPVDLSGWRLLTEDEPLSPFVFHNLTLSPGERAVIFADGQEKTGALHAPFRLSASGETVLLLNASGAEADRVELPAMRPDQSCSRTEDGGWVFTLYSTPGMENLPENAVVRTVIQDAICLSEVVPDNVSLTGGAHDLIELVNTSGRNVSLVGYMLSDDPSRPDKYVLGDVILAPGQHYLIEADGDNVPFRLKASGEQLSLVTPDGQLAGYVSWEEIGADQSFALVNGEWMRTAVATPGFPNTAEGAAAIDRQRTDANATGLFINELMVSGAEEYDWVELYNAGSSAISLNGFGLSDDSDNPRKWQFPEGASVEAGGYLVVYLSGRDTIDRSKHYHTNFGVSCTEPEALTLCLPDGTIIDRAAMQRMYGDVSVGRKREGGFAYLAEKTPGAANAEKTYDARAEKPVFSAMGGLYAAGETLELTIEAPEGVHVYYTLDSSDPTRDSALYTGPITLNKTTVVRAAAFGADLYPSYIETQSYLFGLSHTVRVVSVVSDPEGLFSDETGIMALGSNGNPEPPYTGANFWKEWERSGHVEIFETDGNTLISQGCAVRLQGANSRARPQKALCLTARMTYDDDNRFRAELFSERNYTEYQSFILRAGGQDGVKTRIRDTVIDELAADAGVFYQESELCVVYLNGEYWGQYDMREKTNRFSIADFEGLEDPDGISIVRNHEQVIRGSDSTYRALMQYIGEHPEATDADISHVESVVDLDNYMGWISVMMYSGNQDVGVRRYRVDNGDGLWRWVIFDMDWAFYNDTDSVRRWLDPAGAGAHNVADNRLFVYVMKNAAVQDRFLSMFGKLVTGPWAAEKMVDRIQTMYDALMPEMEAHFNRWTDIKLIEWSDYMDEMLEYAAVREEKIIGYAQQHFGLNSEQMARYFGPEYGGSGR